MKIVPMKEEHTEQLAELEKLCFSAPWSRKSLLEEVENPNAYFVTALKGDTILGYGGMHCAYREFYIDNVGVFRPHRKQGVGAAIMEALIGEARARGGEFISLEVRLTNEAAIRLYTRLGFQQEGRRKDFYTNPVEDCLILTKRF